MVTEALSTSFDVAVVGGGPAGAASAITLRRLGRTVVLVEKSHYHVPRVGETLPPSVRPVLCDLDVWPAFQALESLPSYGTQSAWGDSQLMSRSFITNPHGTGWHVDRQKFDAMLAGAAADAGVKVLLDVRVTEDASYADGKWRLPIQAQDGDLDRELPDSLYAKALIDASGRKPQLAGRLGTTREIYDSLVGIAVQFEGRTEDAGRFTLVEAVENGWWYSVPLPNGRIVVVYMTDADLFARYHRLKTADWMRSVGKTRHTVSRCEGCSPVWGPQIFSAISHRRRRSSFAECWLAVGTAALGVDPLSSSGIVRSLRSGQQAAMAIDRWLAGDRSALEEYEGILDAEFEQYLRYRRAYYELETRWPDAPFWRRRTTATAAGAGN